MPAEAPPRPAMFPLMVDLTQQTIFVVGAGFSLEPRLAAMKAYGATRVHVFAADPPPEAATLAGDQLIRRWPTAEDFTAHRPGIVFVADIDDAQAAGFRTLAHAVGALVHVQDRIPLCDFHLPAILRHGHFQVTVSTDGTAAGLSRVLRDYLGENVFGPEWAGRLEDVSEARLAWKKQGLTMAKLGEAIATMVRERGWLK